MNIFPFYRGIEFQPPIPIEGDEERGMFIMPEERPQEVASTEEIEDHIYECLSADRECNFDELLPENPTRLDAARVFVALLGMYCS